jgi:hypothetical protein
LRRLAGFADQVSSDIQADDIRAEQIDSAFREMGVDAPISMEGARLTLAVQSARRVLDGGSNVFDEATYIRIHLCKLSEPPETLKSIVNLSKEARNAPRSEWGRIEADLTNAFSEFLSKPQP